MANRIRIKRSGTASQAPSTLDLLTGELAINYAEGKLYALKDNGSQSVITIGEDLSSESFADRIRAIVGITDTFEPTGFPSRTDSVISFDSGTRTFTIAPSSDSFSVWCKGKKYNYTTAQTVQIGNVTELHYIYFNQSGVLSTRESYFDWENDAPVAYIYWNAITSSAPYFADERHGVTLDWATHEYLHRTRGAVFANGFSISNYTTTGSGSSDSHAEIDLSGGTFFDEDLEVDIIHSNTPTPNTWEQDLQGPARIPVLYLEGTAWRITTPTNFPLKSGTSRPQYNLLSGGSWSTVDATASRYINVWILATNNLNYPVIGILGQSQHFTLGSAQEVVFSDLVLTGFPSVEFRPLYKLTFLVGNYSNNAKAALRYVSDIRSVGSTGVGAAIASDHGLLSGLGDDDHEQYLHTTSTRTGITANIETSGTLATSNTTATTSATTGALVVGGGVGVAGNLYLGGSLENATIDCGTY